LDSSCALLGTIKFLDTHYPNPTFFFRHDLEWNL
jgi:hypothetical protein